VAKAGVDAPPPARILIADDDPVMRELASARLKDAGYEASCAVDGAEAFGRILAGGADLVISDLEMPVMNGLELTRRIRMTPSAADTPVIVITGSDHADAVDSAFGAGATSFLAKPINWTLFTHSVRFVLKASSDQIALKAARDQAEAGARFKDSLMSVMSHELRTPLNAIIGFGQILSEQFEREHDHLRREYADYVVDGGKRLLNSVSDMLLASDARSGPIVVNEVDCTVGEIVEFAISAAAKTAALAEARIITAVEDQHLEVCCDRILMTRAVTKLIDNAIKFSPRRVRIIVGAAKTGSGGLALVVEDNGPGIPPERIEHLAQPFAQADMSLKRSKEGLGLGLPLAQAIASAHGASFKLARATEGGTRAAIIIPSYRVLATRPRRRALTR
jgi:signal transduction histidine kinase